MHTKQTGIPPTLRQYVGALWIALRNPPEPERASTHLYITRHNPSDTMMVSRFQSPGLRLPSRCLQIIKDTAD